MIGQKHLVQCTCILPQFKNTTPTVFHKFVVFSIIDDNDNVVSSLVNCNNCGAAHKILDLCRSEIIHNKSDIASVVNLEDLKLTFPDKIKSILEAYNADLPTWQEAGFIVEHEKWGSIVVLSSDEVDGQRNIKYLKIVGRELIKIEQYTSQSTIG